MSEKLIFNECLLVIDEDGGIEPNIDMFNNIEDDLFEKDNTQYSINCRLINGKYFWMYAQYGKAKPYSEKVIDVETKEHIENPRKPTSAELRQQFFCIYDFNKKILYMSDSRKNNFLSLYLKEKFSKNFIIKNYFLSLEDFTKEISHLKTFKFSSRNKNVFNAGIFKETEDIFGLDGLRQYTLEMQFDNAKPNFSKLFNLFKKKDDEIFDRMIIVGKDNNGIEKYFTLDKYLKKIEIDTPKDENQMYSENNVKEQLLRKLNV